MARILVVDDESNIRMMLKLALVHVGHEVETASDGYEGLERFGSGAGWDLVLLDQRMPGMEGLDVLREIRRRDPAARVVMITAFGTVDLATEAMRAGITDFLRKPFTVETLRAAVGAALGGQPASQTVDQPPSPIPYAFDLATVNGYRLGSLPGVSTGKDGGINDVFTVTAAATGQTWQCRVSVPCYVAELVKAHADLDEMPGGEPFWQALCGEALANYLWQNAAPPPGDTLIVDDLTSGLRHWIDAVLSATGK
ncbi:MAG: response regulator [Cytophagales bacterium]|nr:response regulator [Armatimonadota bacterium]